MKQAVPRWTSTDAAIQRAYDTYVDKVCPCIVVVHSQGGNFGFTAALNAPDKIRRSSPSSRRARPIRPRWTSPS